MRPPICRALPAGSLGGLLKVLGPAHGVPVSRRAWCQCCDLKGHHLNRGCWGCLFLYLSLLVDLTVPGVGPPWLSSNRFRAFDLGLGAASDLGPPSSERPGCRESHRSEGAPPGLPETQCPLFLGGNWGIVGTESGRKETQYIFLNNWFSCWWKVPPPPPITKNMCIAKNFRNSNRETQKS